MSGSLREGQIIESSSVSVSPVASFAINGTSDQDLKLTKCDGGFFWYDTFLVVSSVLFVLYLAAHAKKNLKRLCNGGSSYIIISYYALLWLVTLFNLAWSFLQAWQCTPGKEVAWDLLSLFTASGMLCLEISLMAFLLKDNYMNGMEALAHTFLVSGIIVFVDALLKYNPYLHLHHHCKENTAAEKAINHCISNLQSRKTVYLLIIICPCQQC